MKTHSGFTLVELMIVLAVAAILTALAAPSFRSMIQNNRAATQANELLSTLQLARSEAVKRGIPVGICASADQSTCSGSVNWATGWIVFTDDGPVAGTRDAGETTLKVHEALAAGTVLDQREGGTSVRFLPSGRVEQLVALEEAEFFLTVPGCTGDQARTIELNLSGRSSVAATSC